MKWKLTLRQIRRISQVEIRAPADTNKCFQEEKKKIAYVVKKFGHHWGWQNVILFRHSDVLMLTVGHLECCRQWEITWFSKNPPPPGHFLMSYWDSVLWSTLSEMAISYNTVFFYSLENKISQSLCTSWHINFVSAYEVWPQRDLNCHCMSLETLHGGELGLSQKGLWVHTQCLGDDGIIHKSFQVSLGYGFLRVSR